MDRRRAWYVIPAVSLGALCLFTPPAAADHGVNCPDFDSQAEAQAFLDRDQSDPEGLDRDRDGQACDNTDFSGAGSGGSSEDTTPDGGVAAGGGGLSGASSIPVLPASGVALGMLLVGAAGATALRRPSTGS